MVNILFFINNNHFFWPLDPWEIMLVAFVTGIIHDLDKQDCGYWETIEDILNPSILSLLSFVISRLDSLTFISLHRKKERNLKRLASDLK